MLQPHGNCPVPVVWADPRCGWIGYRRAHQGAGYRRCCLSCQLSLPSCQAPQNWLDNNKRASGQANSNLERLDQPLGIDKAQPRKLPDATHRRYGLSGCQEVFDFGPPLLVQEGDELFTSPAIRFLLGRPRYSDWPEP